MVHQHSRQYVETHQRPLHHVRAGVQAERVVVVAALAVTGRGGLVAVLVDCAVEVVDAVELVQAAVVCVDDVPGCVETWEDVGDGHTLASSEGHWGEAEQQQQHIQLTQHE